MYTSKLHLEKGDQSSLGGTITKTLSIVLLTKPKSQTINAKRYVDIVLVGSKTVISTFWPSMVTLVVSEEEKGNLINV